MSKSTIKSTAKQQLVDQLKALRAERKARKQQFTKTLTDEYTIYRKFVKETVSKIKTLLQQIDEVQTAEKAEKAKVKAAKAQERAEKKAAKSKAKAEKQVKVTAEKTETKAVAKKTTSAKKTVEKTAVKKATAKVAK